MSSSWLSNDYTTRLVPFNTDVVYSKILIVKVFSFFLSFFLFLFPNSYSEVTSPQCKKYWTKTCPKPKSKSSTYNSTWHGLFAQIPHNYTIGQHELDSWLTFLSTSRVGLTAHASFYFTNWDYGPQFFFEISYLCTSSKITYAFF